MTSRHDHTLDAKLHPGCAMCDEIQHRLELDKRDAALIRHLPEPIPSRVRHDPR